MFFPNMNFRKKHVILIVLSIFTTLALTQVIIQFFFALTWSCPSGNLLCKRTIHIQPKVIHFTTKWWQNHFPFLEEANQMCPQCIFTEEPSFMNTADAVVFHGQFLNQDKPSFRPEGQIWVFMLFETNIRGSEQQIKNYYNAFNWTLTYRRDSDIFVPYGRFVKKYETKLPDFNETWAYMPAVDGTPLAYKRDIPEVETFRDRKMVAWIVSRCQSAIKREDLAKELGKHVPLHIYGNCGTYNCTVPKREAKTGTDCRLQIGEEYKFYLAFENTRCEDYVTEKLFDTLLTNMVPIVYGGADYEKMFPPKAFINVEDFVSIEQLADYLKYLDKNITAYMEYFQWRKDYWVQNNRFVTGFCELCKKLWSEKHVMKSIPDVFEWWNGKSYDIKEPVCSTEDLPFGLSLGVNFYQ